MPTANGEARPARTPSATYRLQLNGQFTFRMLTSLIDYLHELGISDGYLSPFLKARSGSTHGYDITDYGTLNPEIGDEQDLRRLAAELKSKGMGMLIDVVPNHMCVAPSNGWWADVLERGRDSPYADFFDIDWNPDQTKTPEPVNYPILNEKVSEALQTQKLRLQFEDGKFILKYDNMPLPLCLGSWVEVLDPTLHRLNESHGKNHPAALELNAILQILRRYKVHRGDNDYYRNRSIVEKRLLALSDSDEEVRHEILRCVEAANSNENLLGNLLSQQAYCLIPWRSETSEINYRRFFDINDLAALRVENPRVFAAINASVLHFVAQSWVSGLRIDHPDGLWDPELYLLEMQRSCEDAKREKYSLIQSAIQPKDPRPFYIVVEKILTGSEALRRTWPVYGTTGYEFLNLLNGVFVEPAGAAKIQEIYADFAGRKMKFDETVYECQKLVLMQNFSGDCHRVFRALLRIRDLPENVTAKELEQALLEMVVSFLVYRSYVRSTSPLADEDQRLLSSALELAKERYPAMSEPTYEYLRSIFSDRIPDELRLRQRIFLCRLQQLTAPVMAKGFEDTALYRYTPLSSLNEVGGDPTSLGTQLSEFHRSNEERFKLWPYTLSATSTHDTKRSEDVRTRLDALSEMPDTWLGALARWRKMNEGLKRIVDGELTPDGHVEYLLYQTLLGAWPLITNAGIWSQFVDRVKQYMVKALREAKIHSNWLTPNEKYEQATTEFIDAMLKSPDSVFMKDIKEFQRVISWAGMLNSLSQTLLKIASPGVPDFYQGTEIWDFSLVDPDNRRPVDYSLRMKLLASFRSEHPLRLIHEMIATPEDGRLKLFLTARSLSCRLKHPDIFWEGAYLPLKVLGPRSERVCAFARKSARCLILVVAGRFFTKLVAPPELPVGSAVWKDCFLVLGKERPGRGTFRDVFTEQEVSAVHIDDAWVLRLTDVFSHLTVAMLELLP